MKRKKSIFEKILVTVGIEILVFAIFIGGYYLFLYVSEIYAKTLDTREIFSEKCEDSKYSDGWLCNLASDTKYFQKIALEQLCLSNKGLVYNHHEYLYCLIPYSDAGKSCKNSDDCLGTCDLTVEVPDFCKKAPIGFELTTLHRYDCTEELTGKCSGEISRVKVESDCSSESVLVQNNNPIIENNIIFEKSLWSVCLE